MGIRFIFLLVALAVIWWILRFYWKTGKNVQQSQQQKLKSDNMVACHHCGLHIPEKEAIKSDEHFFCCQEHKQLEHDQTRQ